MNNKGKTKNKSVKFLLAPRPQRDPLAADFEAPQHVLVPKGGLDVEQAKKKLPDFDETLFESKDETRTGMLERAHLANGMTFDPDLLQAMSKDFDYEDPNNVLDDTFVTQAGGFIEDEGEMLNDEVSDLTKDLFEDEPELVQFGDEDMDGSDCDDDDDYDSETYDLDSEMGRQNDANEQDCSGHGQRLILFKKASTKRGIRSNKERSNFQSHDDNKSVFTNYSMTSSVMRRSKGLQDMDEHFERLFENEYADDTEIGALDLKDVKGDELLKNLDQIKNLKDEVKVVRNLHQGEEYKPEVVSDHYKDAIIGDDPLPDDDYTSEDEADRKEKRLDCESILSLNSNLYNHPRMIVERGRRTASKNSTNTADQMDLDEDSDQRSRSEVSRSVASTRASVLSKLSIRPKDETTEDRKARKKALKVYRQERRKERKQNQQIFKTEQANIIKQQRTNRPTLRLA